MGDRGVFYGSPSQDYVDGGRGLNTWQFTRRGVFSATRAQMGTCCRAVGRKQRHHRHLFPDGTPHAVSAAAGRGIGLVAGRIVAIDY